MGTLEGHQDALDKRASCVLQGGDDSLPYSCPARGGRIRQLFLKALPTSYPIPSIMDIPRRCLSVGNDTGRSPPLTHCTETSPRRCSADRIPGIDAQERPARCRDAHTADRGAGAGARFPRRRPRPWARWLDGLGGLHAAGSRRLSRRPTDDLPFSVPSSPLRTRRLSAPTSSPSSRSSTDTPPSTFRYRDRDSRTSSLSFDESAGSRLTSKASRALSMLPRASSFIGRLSPLVQGQAAPCTADRYRRWIQLLASPIPGIRGAPGSGELVCATRLPSKCWTSVGGANPGAPGCRQERGRVGRAFPRDAGLVQGWIRDGCWRGSHGENLGTPGCCILEGGPGSAGE
ncbi:hypothetical protein DFH07DRAFT_964620 [Mycena maculata]|uniref:Uncharacterized protein n=1 Tax=Mycena maculata TaxID=230809 RepID=A0AAD7IG65_9AGAR|nr:hypothetical protein DFH07DRAFT_964620 [Mycena maculata]